MRKCLYCYLSLGLNEKDLHPKCSKFFFGQKVVPILPYSESNLEELAEQVIKSQTTVTGVQPKLSLHIDTSKKDEAMRFTIVGLWGDFILKPPTAHYFQLPEVEDLTMHLASIARIKVVPHTLIRLATGNLSYITKRIDRTKKEKLHMEDMCQLTEHLSEDKYNGSYEQIVKIIQKYVANPGLDVVAFFEILLFSFLTGNSDMHLKNFSLIHQPNIGFCLSPAYDLLSTVIVYPADDEDFALTLNGKKKKIRLADFIAAANNAKLDNKQQQNIFNKMLKAKPQWFEMIEKSFLNDELKASYKELIDKRFERLTKSKG